MAGKLLGCIRVLFYHFDAFTLVIVSLRGRGGYGDDDLRAKLSRSKGSWNLSFK